MLCVFWITRDCNLRCDYCYLEKSKNYMNEDIAMKAVDFSIKNLLEKGEKDEFNKIVLHGGEPTLNFKVLKKIVNKYNEIKDDNMNFEFDMTTNATIINDEIINFIKTNNISLSVSVDGQKENHNIHRKFVNGQGSFDKVISNLIRYKDSGINIRIRMTVTTETIDNIFEDYKFFYELGFRSITFILDIYNTKWEKRHIEQYYYNQKRIIEFLRQRDNEAFISYLINLINNIHRVKGVCSGGKNEFSINYNGDLYPCTFSIDNREYLIGNITSGIDKNKLDKICEINEIKNEKCNGCGFYRVCNGARCKILNKTITGDYYTPNAVNCHINKVIKDIEKEYKDYLVNYKEKIEFVNEFMKKRGARMI